MSIPVHADTPERRKSRGAFFTPGPIARYVTDWAIRDPKDRVLEPSCGDAEFLVHAVKRLVDLTDKEGMFPLAPSVFGVEIHADSATTARGRVTDAGGVPEITVNDFFMVDPTPTYDAVIGNPPYIRYQDWAGASRTRSRAAALRAGVPLTELASSWAAFTVYSALFLKKGGRLGLVLPAELLAVNYAAPVREFLLKRFRAVELVIFTEQVFPDADTETVLLLADGYGETGTDHFRVTQTRNAASLDELAVSRTWTPATAGAKWTSALLHPAAIATHTRLIGQGSFVGLETWGDTTLGMVTGNNRYFAMTPERVLEAGIPQHELLRLSPPGSSHLRGLSFSTSALDEMGERGSAVWLFRPSGEPSENARAYIEMGEATGVNEAYKCRVRKPWWRVPLLKPADLLLTYMNADTPRLTTNSAKAHHLNSVHGVYLHAGHKALGQRALPLASLTSMTLMAAETVGRAYGGGILKLEPREADVLPVPSPAVVEACVAKLSVMRPQVGRFLRSGELLEAAKLVDDVILRGELGMARNDVTVLREQHAALTARRVARSRRGTS